jgi:rubrerythrin
MAVPSQGEERMKLGTAGAVLAFAIDLEARSAEFYQRAATLAKDPAHTEVLLSLAEAKRERKKLLERSRREYVNEILLEPIDGLEAGQYLVQTDLSSEKDPGAVRQAAEELEANSRRFYLDAAELMVLPQIARVLRKLAQGNADHRLRLDSL